MSRKVKDKSKTVCQSVPEYLLNVELRNSEETYKFYAQYLRFICQFIGDLRIWELSREDIDRMLSLKRQQNPKISNATLNKYIVTTKNLYKFITGRNLEYKKLKESRAVKEKIDGRIIKHIFEYLHERRYDKLIFRNYIFIRFLYDTGLRLNEITHIKVADINLDGDYITVRETKSGHERIVVIHPETKILLRQFLIATEHSHEYLFISYKKGKRLAKSSVHSMLKSLKEILQLKININPHAWRHTFASNFLRDGGDMRTLQLLMGHTNYATTEKYLHYDNEEIINSYKRVMKNKKLDFEF